MVEVHPTAIVAPGAQLGDGTVVGPYSVIGPQVVMGCRNRIGPHVVIEGDTTLGDENVVFQFASLGAVPQDLKYRGEKSRLLIGDRNIIREYSTLQPGTELGLMKTTIGNGNLFMAGTHVGHDGVVGNSNVFANCCALAGHVTIGDGVIVGGMAGVHQFTRIGDLAILGAGTMTAKDVPPFCMAQGDRARLIGLNSIGLKRRKHTAQDIRRLKLLFRAVFLGSGRFHDRLEAFQEQATAFDLGRIFMNFLQAPSKRGITPVRRALAGRDRSDIDDE